MGKNIKKNYIYNVSYQILTLITPFITTPYVSRVLGVGGIGEYSFSFSIVTYFLTLAAMGTAAYGQREISYVQDNKNKYSSVFWNTEIFSCLSTLLCLFAYLIYIFLCTSEKLLYLSLSLNIVAVAFDITWFFQGLEEFKIVVLRNTVFKVLNILFIFLFVKTQNDLLVYAFGMSLFTLLAAISMWTYLPKYINKLCFRDLHMLSVFKGTFILFLPAIATTLYSVLDKTMIGLITSSSYENGYYEQASKIVKMTLTVITSLGTVMIPRIGFYFEKGRTKELQEYMYRSYRFTWFIGFPLCFGLISIAANFVPWFFGNGYEKVPELIYILSFLIPIIGVSTITGSQYMVPTKQQNWFNISIFIGLCVNICLNSICIPFFLSAGAAYASVIAELSIAIFQFIHIRKQLSISKILKTAVPYLLSSLIMCVFVFYVGYKIKSSIINTLLLIILGATIYCILLFARKDVMIIYVKDVVKRKLKKK